MASTPKLAPERVITAPPTVPVTAIAMGWARSSAAVHVTTTGGPYEVCRASGAGCGVVEHCLATHTDHVKLNPTPSGTAQAILVSLEVTTQSVVVMVTTPCWGERKKRIRRRHKSWGGGGARGVG